jgi:predicted nucleic acid-binding protein
MIRQPNHLLADAMIAATARVHGLIVATRNVADFRGFEVPVFNPFSARH